MLADRVRPPKASSPSKRPPPTVAALEEADLAAINHWLSVTRMRTVAIAIVATPLIGLLGGLDLRWLPLTAVCLATAVLSPLYEWWMRRGGSLHALVYAQLLLDTVGITVGLAILGPPGHLFGYFYLMTIVPATMVSGTCAIALTLFSGACYAMLLQLAPLDSVHTVTEAGLWVIAIYIFAAVANQCFWYKRHIRDKNRHLAATGAWLADTNTELRVAAETATALVEVARAVGNSLDLGIVLDRLHAVALERLKTDWCATLLVDPASAAGYRLIASRGLGAASQMVLDSAFWTFGARIAAEDLVELSELRPRSPEARALEGWPAASGLFAGMRYGNRAVGVFATGYSLRTGEFTRAQRDLATGIAAQAAVATENATLHKRQRREAEISAALLKVAEVINARIGSENPLEPLTRLTAELPGCDRVSVLLYSPDRRTVRIIAGTDRDLEAQNDEVREIDHDVRQLPLLAEAVRQGWAESWVGDGKSYMDGALFKRLGLRSVINVPLVLRGEPIGILAAGSRRHAGPFAEDTRRVLIGVALQAVTALENSRLVSTLRAANNLKSEFISTMSHELRTPLNAIIGYSELIAEGQFGPVNDEQQGICAKVLASSRQLLELIQATLDVNRLESGTLPVTLGPVDVRTVLDEVAAEIPAALQKPGVEIDVQADRGLPSIDSDHPKVKMIVRNLTHNALKFTDHGFVAVRAAVADDGAHLAITVRDSGVGISPEGQAIIFEMFRQVDGSDRRRHDGVGLGLYIVQRVTTLLGGTVRVESEVGEGSCFTVTLPLGRPGLRRRDTSAEASAAL